MASSSSLRAPQHLQRLLPLPPSSTTILQKVYTATSLPYIYFDHRFHRFYHLPEGTIHSIYGNTTLQKGPPQQFCKPLLLRSTWKTEETSKYCSWHWSSFNLPSDWEELFDAEGKIKRVSFISRLLGLGERGRGVKLELLKLILEEWCIFYWDN